MGGADEEAVRVEVRRQRKDSTAPDGGPLVGRGYQAHDDDGNPLDAGALHPDAFAGMAVVGVEPRTAEQRQALATAAFGLGRPVRLDVDAAAVRVLDEDGAACAGAVDDDLREPTVRLLEREPDLATWVSWEWLGEAGRSAITVALSRPELAPQRLEPPPQPSGARALVRDRRVWLALAAVVVLLVVAFVSCA